jgi:hypothetical protein
MLVCTLPSPACMCSATNTRPRSTARWIASHSAITGANACPLNRIARAARAAPASRTRGSCGPAAGRTARRRARAGGVALFPRAAGRLTGERLAHRGFSGRRCSSSRNCQRARARRSALARLRDGSVAETCGRGRRPRRRSCPAAARRANSARARRAGAACCAIDSSMLMRSMPSVYSPSRGSGITTSSLILKALVCGRSPRCARGRARRSCAPRRETAMKPSPARVGDAHHLGGGAATASSSSPTMSPISTIFGRPPRATWSRSRPRAGSARRGARGRRGTRRGGVRPSR